MSTTKIAITIDEELLGKLDRLVSSRVFPNRSKAIQEAVQEKLSRVNKSRLARECAKLDPKFEKLRAGLAGGRAGDDPLLTGGARTAPADSSACRELAELRGEADYLEAIASDLRDIRKLTPGHPMAELLAERYETRLDAAFRSLDKLRDRASDCPANP